MNVQQQNYPNNNLGYNNQQSMMGGYNYNNPNNNSLNMSGNYANLGYPQQQPINYGLNMQTNQQSYGQIQQIQQPISLSKHFIIFLCKIRPSTTSYQFHPSPISQYKIINRNFLINYYYIK